MVEINLFFYNQGLLYMIEIVELHASFHRFDFEKKTHTSHHILLYLLSIIGGREIKKIQISSIGIEIRRNTYLAIRLLLLHHGSLQEELLMVD